MYAATGGPNVKWGAPISNGGFQAPMPPAGDGPALSQKYFSPTLITSMSSVIHHILVKNPNEINEVLLTTDVWSNRQMRSWRHCSFDFKFKDAQCYSGLQTILIRSQKKYSAILKLLTNEFSALLDECSSLIDVAWLLKIWSLDIFQL